MPRANLYINLSDGTKLQCVCDRSSAPEQGFIVETLILPLLRLNDAAKEVTLLKRYCIMDELYSNADYRYRIDLGKKEVSFYEEWYFHKTESFRKGANLTERYVSHLQQESELEKLVKEQFFAYSNEALIIRANAKADFDWDDESTELYRRWRVSAGVFDYEMRGNKLVITKDKKL